MVSATAATTTHDEATDRLERIWRAKIAMDHAGAVRTEIRTQMMAATAKFRELEREWLMLASPDPDTPLVTEMVKNANGNRRLHPPGLQNGSVLASDAQVSINALGLALKTEEALLKDGYKTIGDLDSLVEMEARKRTYLWKRIGLTQTQGDNALRILQAYRDRAGAEKPRS